MLGKKKSFDTVITDITILAPIRNAPLSLDAAVWLWVFPQQWVVIGNSRYYHDGTIKTFALPRAIWGLSGYSGWASEFIITPTDSRIDSMVPFSFSAEKEFQFYLFTAGGDMLPIVPIPGESFSAQCGMTPTMGNIADAWNLGTKSPEQIGYVTRVNRYRFTLVNNSGQPIELNNYILAMLAEGSEPTYLEYVYINGTFPAKQVCSISVPSEVNLGSIPASDFRLGRVANDFRKTLLLILTAEAERQK